MRDGLELKRMRQVFSDLLTIDHNIDRWIHLHLLGGKAHRPYQHHRNQERQT
jgi:hypothetical protein